MVNAPNAATTGLFRFGYEACDEAATFGYPRARVFEQRVKDLWLSATGAVLNGG
jgi:hypothetical protein